MIKALIFDFDGLILDTETPEYLTWQEIYAEYGQTLAVEAWGQFVGGNGASDFNPVSHLEQLTGIKLDGAALKQQARQMDKVRVAEQPILPGVVDYLDEADHLGLRLAIASSSPHSWVDTHLSRIGLLSRFEAIVCADDVARTKPHPDLFLEAARRLGVRPDEAIVFEDSPNGVKAANAAEIYVVAIPNPLTARLSFAGENLRLQSLSDLSLIKLLTKLE